jgi:glycosyltransferase involved in cell wall biosynthesis
MKILFLDQSGQIGGAELTLQDLAEYYAQSCLVGLFADGPFRESLCDRGIPTQVLSRNTLKTRKDSSLLDGLKSIKPLIPLIWKVSQLSQQYDMIFANTQKALIVGAIASRISQCPLVYYLHDILSLDHFSASNLKIAIKLANQSKLVIANSEASRTAFIAAGGRSEITHVVYNGFDLTQYENLQRPAHDLRNELDLTHQFVVGHFSRLSPWKGQHILLEALAHCPENVVGLFVGDALFGEQQYVKDLQTTIDRLNLSHRVHFLGFRQDIPQLMAACNLVAHTSIAPEPFGRVIVEAMLCERPVVVAAAGGAVELVESEKTGWLIQPNDPIRLSQVILQCLNHPEKSTAIARAAKRVARDRFNVIQTRQAIDTLLQKVR